MLFLKFFVYIVYNFGDSLVLVLFLYEIFIYLWLDEDEEQGMIETN